MISGACVYAYKATSGVGETGPLLYLLVQHIRITGGERCVYEERSLKGGLTLMVAAY